MKRINETVPVWTGEMWVYRPSINGVQKRFQSHKPGPPGSAECKKLYSLELAGESKQSPRLEKAWPLFLADKAERLGPASDGYIKAERYGRLYILPMLKNKRVADITEQDWQDCINKAKPVSDQTTRLSKKYLSNIRGEIMAFAKFAKKSRMIDSMPDDITIPKTAPVIGKQIIQPDALRSFLLDDGDWWYLRAWQLMAVTGLRPGECYGLQINDIKNGLIKVRRSINSTGNITYGKNENALRTIVQNTWAKQIINKQIEQLSQAGIDLPWLFPDRDGCKPIPSTIRHQWDSYSARFDARITQYCLRHTFVSIMQNDLPDGMLKDNVGHSKSMDTLGTYGHAVNGNLEQSAAIIGKVFDRITNKDQIIRKLGGQT